MEQTQPDQAPQPAVPNPQPEKSNSSKGLAITALVLGIVAFCVGWTGPFGLVVASAAVVFGIVALVKKQNKGMGIAGVVLGGIALITATVVTLGMAAFFGGVAQVANETAQQQKAVDNTKKVFAKGEVAQFDKLQVKVSAVTVGWQPDDGFSKPNDGKQYALVSVNIKNTSDETVTVNPFDFKIDENGTASDHDFTTTATPLNSVELKPGATVSGDLVFQVGQGAVGLKLQYKTYNDKTLEEVTYSVGL